MYHVEHIGLTTMLKLYSEEAAEKLSRQLPLTVEPQAVEHYLNREVPSTHHLIAINRIEYPGLHSSDNIVYQFTWSVPE